ncbi:serine hydrolase [Desulfoprunum benzoelyticum]|uniref:CubicO group peptidase (Beta-lactamase class C family) n=1 Tax=Desulfoprunum benzoelyticum TaxID=1506996 RepID=A0A840V1C2_9BACT|nr:serine hydrolase [Desulfoprunum benzoelyticum]MBB5347499.1 CubicO group peptidase (beta-lactamase class C family) [Desulfoprunum benzoelyticum]MBM9529624.1 serine hydrolase [Desulfoprunum benzoelyticum]
MKLSDGKLKDNLSQHLEKKGFEVLQQGVSGGVFPGGVGGIIIDRHDIRERVVWTCGYTDNNRRHVVQEQTFYDLASLTKPLVTVLSLLVLIEKNKITWNTPLADLLQRSVPVEKKRINLTSLMQHNSGLPAYKPYYIDLLKFADEQVRKDKIVESILNEPFEYTPGSSTLYSDLGFILLGHAIEQLSVEPLDSFWENNVVLPLSLEKQLLFSPNRKNIGNGLVASTELCPWTKKMLCGEVHDENCRSLGGVAGHAGLFGTIVGVLDMCKHLLRQWRGDEEHPQYSSGLLRYMFEHKPGSAWRYGFDTPSKINSSSGRFFSSRSVGHLGFTGTSFWIDLEKGVAVVLLTNRVHPSRVNEKIRKFRPLFHDALMQSLVECIV